MSGWLIATLVAVTGVGVWGMRSAWKQIRANSWKEASKW